MKSKFTRAAILLCSFVLVLSVKSFAGISTTWNGSISTDWGTAGNWSFGVPTASVPAIIATAGKQPTISATAVCATLTINSGCTLTMSGAVTLTISGGFTNNSSTSGGFVAGSGTVIFNATATIGGTQSTAFNNLTISSGTITVATNIT